MQIEARKWYFSGLSLLQQGEFARAEEELRRAVALAPQHGDTWELLSIACYAQRRWTETAAACQRAAALAPERALTWARLGAAQVAMGELRSAEVALREALRLAPDDANMQADYGHLLCDTQRPEPALAVFSQILQREPAQERAAIGKARAHALLGEWDKAAVACRASLARNPGSREARRVLAMACMVLWNLTEAEAILTHLVLEFPNEASYWGLLGNAWNKAGRVTEAATAWQRSVALDPQPIPQAALLMNLHYLDGSTPEDILQQHRDWSAQYAEPLLPRTMAPVAAAKKRKLRIGFVSADFACHPVGFLALPAIEHLDRQECSVVCYSDRLHDDELTQRFRAASDSWRSTAAMLPDELAEQIRGDEIDILFDLMGHTGKRLPTFARKPAPVQVTWLGCVGTTGLAAMDYLLADRFHVREGEEGWYTEQVLRMPNGYACYGPPANAPEVGPLSALTTGEVTFGCFNNPAKYAPRIMAAWAEVLRRLPRSRLLLKYGGLHEPQVQRRIQEQFVQRGIAAERIEMEGWSPPRELLAAYNRVDLALDTQPYSGGLTTCEALWMGVPVITCPGRTFAGRHSVSHLTNTGYPQFIAEDLAGYVELAVHWANHLEELAVIRAEMRERVRQSPLCDAPRFAHDFLSVLRQAWESRVAS